MPPKKSNQDFNPPANKVGGTPFMGLLEPGNIQNLYNRPVLQNKDNSYSTTLSKSFNFDGFETLLPTVVDGKQLSDEEAIKRFHETGQHLGKFATPQEADYYAQKLHNSQQAMGMFYGPTSKNMPKAKEKKRVARK
jgi:hypothetical protein